MKKINDARSKILNINLDKTEYIFQTFWSDFVHVTGVDKNKSYEIKDTNLGNSEFDFTDYNNDNYTVFQNEDLFVNYNNSESDKIQISNNSEINEIKITSNNNSNNELTLITRIPQEFNLDLKTNRNLKFINSGDSKLIADKKIKIEFLEDKDLENKYYSFDAKRIRTENFYLNSEFKSIMMTIKSYIEANKLFLSLPYPSNLKIKKLGVVRDGKIILNNADVKIDSIYGPSKDKEDKLEFNINNTLINVGSLQGNVNINTQGHSKIIIDNMECNNFNLNSKDDLNAQLEIFVNEIKNSLIIKGEKIKIIIYVNLDSKEKIEVRHNNEIIFRRKANQPQEEDQEENHIEVYTDKENLIEVVETNAWEYMKKKLTRKNYIKS